MRSSAPSRMVLGGCSCASARVDAAATARAATSVLGNIACSNQEVSLSLKSLSGGPRRLSAIDEAEKWTSHQRRTDGHHDEDRKQDRCNDAARCSPMFSRISSISPRAFIKVAMLSASRVEAPVKRAAMKQGQRLCPRTRPGRPARSRSTTMLNPGGRSEAVQARCAKKSGSSSEVMVTASIFDCSFARQETACGVAAPAAGSAEFADERMPTRSVSHAPPASSASMCRENPGSQAPAILSGCFEPDESMGRMAPEDSGST